MKDNDKASSDKVLVVSKEGTLVEVDLKELGEVVSVDHRIMLIAALFETFMIYLQHPDSSLFETMHTGIEELKEKATRRRGGMS